MEKQERISFASDSSSERRLALAMFLAGVLVWFLTDATKPLARDLLKGVGFFLFAYGFLSLNKWKRWSELSKREKNMRILFYLVMAIIVLLTLLWMFLSR